MGDTSGWGQGVGTSAGKESTGGQPKEAPTPSNPQRSPSDHQPSFNNPWTYTLHWVIQNQSEGSHWQQTLANKAFPFLWRQQKLNDATATGYWLRLRVKTKSKGYCNMHVLVRNLHRSSTYSLLIKKSCKKKKRILNRLKWHKSHGGSHLWNRIWCMLLSRVYKNQQ